MEKGKLDKCDREHPLVDFAAEEEAIGGLLPAVAI